MQGGIDLTTLNAALPEKTGELALYSIQPEKTNQQRQVNDRKREADINELKKLVR